MKKYFIVLILGLLLGLLFARSMYSQENYFTPGLTMKALQENKENSEGEKVKGSHNFYYKQYTYPAYIEGLDDFETKYVLYLRSTKYPDVEFTLTYLQPYFVYSEPVTTAMSIGILLTCIQDNIEEVQNTISYCNTCKYDKSLAESLDILIYHLTMMHDYIKDCANKYLESYKQEDFASCIKYMIAIENVYWELFVKIGSMENPNGTNTVTITYTEKE